MRYRGAIDTPQSDTVSGWAVDAQGEACEVTLVVNGGAPVTVKSDQPRPDLAKGGVSKGQGGFRSNVATSIMDGENLIEIRFADGTHVPGSPIRRTVAPKPAAPPSGYRGFIDNGLADTISGWALTNDGLPCIVTVEVNGTDRLMARSDRPRPDLMKGGVSQGLGGFHIAVRSALRPGSNEIAVLFPNGKHVSGSPISRVLPGGEPKRTAASPTPTAPPTANADELDGFVDALAPPSLPKPGKATPEKKRVPSVKSAAAAKPRKLSLAELDELSLDDISLAVASGMISVPAPDIPAAPSEEAATEQPPADVGARDRRGGAGWLGKLFGRK